MKLRQIILNAVFAGTMVGSIRADDWPQWRGPQRDGTSKETGLLKEWPKDGPKLAWKTDKLGGGYSTPVIVGDRIYLMYDRKENEYTVALDAETGEEIWAIEIGKVGKNQGIQYPGARSTPTVEGDRIYALGSDGDLACLKKDKGDIVWKKNFKADFDGKPGMWAYSESVLIDGDALICTPGGEKATMLALNKKDGEVIWKCAVPSKDAAGYASPIIVEADKVKQYVTFVQTGVIGVDAKSGNFLWKYEKTKDPMSVNIMTPVAYDGAVFSSSGRVGSALTTLRPDKDGVAAEEAYFTKDLATSIGGVVRVGDHIYGMGAKGLTCLEWKTGKMKWQDKSLGQGSLCFADGLLFLHGENGDVALVETSPEGCHEKGRFTPSDQPKHPGNNGPLDVKAWAHPVVANGRLYIRDLNTLWCYEVK